jgi:hypothetical protein
MASYNGDHIVNDPTHQLTIATARWQTEFNRLTDLRKKVIDKAGGDVLDSLLSDCAQTLGAIRSEIYVKK